MCGIAGIVCFEHRPDSDKLRRVVLSMLHRGPDHQAIWQDDHAVLGHTRLAIIDLSSAGHQPMVDPETGNVIVYNGEIYNFQLLRADLEKQGFRFRSNSDTEVLLALYRRYGVRCLERLRGMFAFGIYDPRHNQLFIARDRLGQKPLVYAQTDEGFLFASEIGALVAHPAVSREIDLEALDLYLSLQYIPAPWTIYKTVRKLPAAHYALLTPTGLHIERYWQLDYTRKIQLGEKEALEAVLEKLTEAVQLQLISDVPLGALLSGGVDSSLVVALMSKLSHRRVKTFSIGFCEEHFNELPHARCVAEHLGTEHWEEVLVPNVLEMLPRIARQFGEPYADKSAVPSFYVAQMARQHVTVVLNGDGGDELAAGYWHYQLPPLAGLISRAVGNYKGRRADIDQADWLLNDKTLLGPLRRFWMYGYAHPEVRSLLYANFWNQAQKGSLFRPEVAAQIGSVTIRWKQGWLEQAYEHADTPIERMLWIGNHTYLPDDLLVEMDIASMAYGLEARSPLLDHELIELCASLPDNLKVRKGQTKYLLKKLAAQFVPSSVVFRQKQGFSVPVGAWLRGPMANFMRQVLTEARPHLNEYFQSQVIDRLVNEHVTGFKEHGYRLWTLLNFALWQIGRG